MKPTEIDVCLVVTTQSEPVEELTRRIGIEASDGSHSKGAPHVLRSRGKWKSTVWQLCSTCARAAPIEEHMVQIAERLPPSRLGAEGVLPGDARVYVSVGVFSSAQIPTIDVTMRTLAICVEYSASLEVRYYVSEDE